MNMLPPLPLIVRRESLAADLTVCIDEQGSGRPLLLLHGGAGPQSVSGFAGTLAQYAHVLAPTHPGFAGEPRPEWFDSVDDLAITYLDLLERLDLHDVIVMGISFGGWIAAEMAVRDTRRVGGVILVDAAGIQVDGYQIVRPPSRPSAAAPTDNAPVPNHEQPTVPATDQQTLAVYTREHGGFSDPKLRRRLARVTIPALVVWGENDPIIAPGYGRAYAQALPNARFALIPACGHLPQLDQPARLLEVVREFTDGLTA